MMNKSQITLLLILVSVFFVGGTVAQSYTAGDQITLHVEDFCLIETNHAPVSMTLSTSIAGTQVSSVSNSDMFVKISSLVPGNTNRKITVRVSNGTVPPGTRLTLVAAPSTNANGGGRLGTVVSPPFVLNAIDHDLVIGIGSCYTGTGYTDGFQLTYTWEPYSPTTDYQLIQATADPTTLTIALTISAHDGNN